MVEEEVLEDIAPIILHQDQFLLQKFLVVVVQYKLVIL